MKSIRAKITAAIVICSLISATLISLMSISDSRDMSNTHAEKELTLSCQRTGEEINALISRVEQSVDTLSAIALQQMDFPKFKSSDFYEVQYTNSLLDDFLTFSENTEGAISSYIRYNPDFTNPTSGIFYNRADTSSDFVPIQPTDFSVYEKDDYAHVGWYYIPVENGAPIWMDPYLNENINVYMVSYVAPLFHEDGTSIGILGMDIDFGQLTSLVDELTAFDSGYAFLLSSEGNVMYHRELDVGTDLTTYNDGELSSIKEFVTNDNEGNILEYTYQGVNKNLTYTELGNEMKLVLCVHAKEIKEEADA